MKKLVLMFGRYLNHHRAQTKGLHEAYTYCCAFSCPGVKQPLTYCTSVPNERAIKSSASWANEERIKDPISSWNLRKRHVDQGAFLNSTIRYARSRNGNAAPLSDRLIEALEADGRVP